MNYSINYSSKSISYITLTAFVTAWLLSFYGFRKHHGIDSTITFIVLFLISSIVWNIQKRSFFTTISKLSFFIIFFICFVTVNSLLNGTPIYEVLVATKPLILFIVLFYSMGKVGLPFVPRNFALQMMKITSALMFVKYSISHLLNLNDRPFLFVENNFELVIPLGLLFCYKNKSTGLTILLLLVILMSGSKSAIGSLILLPIISCAYRKNFMVKFGLAGLLILAITSLIRFGVFDEVDRFVYITNIYSFYDLSPVNVFFGDFQVSPLLSEACELFKYMGPEKVTQEGGRFVCYSRVANFTTVRLFVDFGIFFGLFFFFGWFINLRKFFPENIAINLFYIGFLNGLSVSGWGNIYYIIMLLMMYSVCGRKRVYPNI